MGSTHRPLLVTPFAPYPARHGGAACAGALLEGLLAGHHPHLVSPRPISPTAARHRPECWTQVRLEPVTRFLRAMGPAFSPRLARTVARVAVAHRADLLQAETLWAARPAARAARRLGLPLVYTAHNAEAEKLRDLGFAAPIVALARRLERQALRAARAVITFSDQDGTSLTHLWPAAAGRIHRIGPAVRCTEPGSPERRARLRHAWEIDPGTLVLLFVGNLLYSPNREALDLLVEKVLPAVSGLPGGCLLVVAGAGADGRTREGRRDLRFTGPVDPTQLAELLEVADVVPVPVQRGSGTSIKVIEAMGAGKTVVTTPIGMRGLDVTPGEELIVAEDEERFSVAIVDLAADEPRRRAVGARARRYALEHHAPDRVAAAYAAVYDEVIAPD